MTREIKFRAWDKETKSMIKEVWEIGLKSNYNQSWLIGDDKRTDNFELMQYTGLKDKNGKEIYEGDIVKSRDNHLFIINYEYGSFGAGWIKDDLVWYSSATKSFDKKIFEVIGNIYENSELLNKRGNNV